MGSGYATAEAILGTTIRVVRSPAIVGHLTLATCCN